MKNFGAIHRTLGACVTIAIVALPAGCGNNSSQGASSLPAAQSVRRATITERVEHNFEGAPKDGAYPQGGVFGVDGDVYVTTARGGAGSCDRGLGCGTLAVFSCCGGFRVFYSFSGYDGAVPRATFLFEPEPYGGTLFGTTELGGAANHGTVFRVYEHRSVRLLYSFRDNPDGRRPFGSLVGGKQDVYGTTAAGGAYGKGTVYEMNEESEAEKVLHSFGKGADGAAPLSALTYINGELYGTTSAGGTSRKGTVFEIGKSGSETLIHSFAGGSDGADPVASLIDVNGALYGTTSAGGTSNEGVVFEVTTSGHEKVLHSFAGGTDGASPQGPLVDVNGTLYGTTCQGGAGSNGTFFSITSGGAETVLYDFTGTPDGSCPRGNLYLAGSTTLWGATLEGGSSDLGAVFSISLP